jgi:hypothetical protein
MKGNCNIHVYPSQNSKMISDINIKQLKLREKCFYINAIIDSTFYTKGLEIRIKALRDKHENGCDAKGLGPIKLSSVLQILLLHVRNNQLCYLS